MKHFVIFYLVTNIIIIVLFLFYLGVTDFLANTQYFCDQRTSRNV